MNLKTEVMKQYKYVGNDLLFYKVLSLFLTCDDDIFCYKSIVSIYNEIKNLYNRFDSLSNEELNILDNDMVTLKDLIDEYKQHVYPLFNNILLMALKNFNEKEFEYMIDYIQKKLNDDTTYEIESALERCRYLICCEYPDIDLSKYQKVAFNTKNTTEIIIDLSKYLKLLKNLEFRKAYLKLVALVFILQNGGEKHVC